MSSPLRSAEVIQQEYSQGCARLGHLQYQVYTLKNDIALLQEHLKELNIEAGKADAAAKKAKEDAAVASAVEVPSA